MAIIRLTATVECKLDTSDHAHELGKELESRIHTALNTIIPNLRHGRFVEDGNVQFSMQITGRRLKIQNVQNGKPAGIEPIKGAKNED